MQIEGQYSAAFVDGGNVFRSVISEEFYRKLPGVQLRPIEIDSIGTASESARLKVLGRVHRPLKLTLLGQPFSFKFQPVVLRGLSMEVNISGPFMKRNEWDELHSRNCLRIKGREVPLQSGAKNPVRTSAYALHSLSIPPHAEKIVELCTPAEKKKAEVLWEDPEGQVQAVVQRNRDGHFRILVRNESDETRRIHKGMSYGVTEGLNSGAVGIHHLGEETLDGRNDAYRRQIMKEARPGKTSGARIDSDLEKKLAQDPRQLTDKERRRYFTQKFQLQDSPLLQDPEDLNLALDTLLKFWDLFSHDGSYGRTELVNFKILTREGPPVKCRYRPIPPDLEGNLRSQLDRWLQEDVIEPSDSPWSSNLVPVKKKNGEIRWCVDWRRLNDVTYKDSWPMPPSRTP